MDTCEGWARNEKGANSHTGAFILEDLTQIREKPHGVRVLQVLPATDKMLWMEAQPTDTM